MDLFNTDSYSYNLPSELIAQKPCEPRDGCRLMVVERETGNIREICFRDLVDYLDEGDRIVFNDTKVMPARLQGIRSTGGKGELFLLKDLGSDQWEVLSKPAKKMRLGDEIKFSDILTATVVEVRLEGIRVVSFRYKAQTFEEALSLVGSIPLPPYIRGGVGEESDKQDYQTIYANKRGAVAAPTAGLHFTENMFQDLDAKNISRHMLTLHVGLGTFRPVQVADIRDHKMHSEYYNIDEAVARALNNKQGRTVCVGTTCCRTLESAADEQGLIGAGEGDTNIFIYPGYKFRYVDALLTNFHLPGSSLIMMVSALAGSELIREAYHKAIMDKYRFYSYGDAMLII